MYRPAVNQQYAISVSGGSENMAWLMSAGYDKNTNELDADYERLNIRFNNLFAVNKRLQVETNIYYTYSENTSGRPAFADQRTTRGGPIYPYLSLTDDAGNPTAFYKDYRQTYIDTAGGGRLPDWKYYPLTDYKYYTLGSKQQSIIGSVTVKYVLMKDLNASVYYQHERQQTTGRSHYKTGSYYARNIINSFSQVNYSTGVVKYIIHKGGILDLIEQLLDADNLRGQLNYNKTFSRHAIVSLTGVEVRNAKSKSNSYTVYGFLDNTNNFSNVDFVNPYPSFISGSSTMIPSGLSFGERLNRFVSVYSNIAYTYDKRIILSGSLRRDASNLFGISTNEKWTPLWSAGGSWIISNENFYKLSRLPQLKLRATYGYGGNVDLSRSAVTTIQYSQNNFLTGLPAATISQFPNPDLRWEKVRTINFGIDITAKDNRLNGSIEYYRKNGIDLFGAALLDYTVGLGRSSIIKNAASMKGHGWDIELNTINTNGKLKWFTMLNFSSTSNRVTKYYIADATGRTLIKDGSSTVLWEGKSLYSLFSYRWAGLDPVTGDPQGYINGQISKDYNALVNIQSPVDLVYSGLSLPPVYGSLRNTISYKGFSLTVNLIYKFGYTFRNGSINYSNLYSRNDGHSDFAKRWQKPGDEKITDIPSMVYPLPSNRDQFYLYSEKLIEKADHIRLHYIHFSYEINKVSFKKLPFQRLQFYSVATNLGIIWKATETKIDPDYPLSAFPPSVAFSVGIRCEW